MGDKTDAHGKNGHENVHARKKQKWKRGKFFDPLNMKERNRLFCIHLFKSQARFILDLAFEARISE